MNARLLVVMLALSLSGCAFIKGTTRRVIDIAADACRSAEASQVEAERAGMSVKEWCKIITNVQPYADAILRAQQKAAVKAGLVVEIPEAE